MDSDSDSDTSRELPFVDLRRRQGAIDSSNDVPPDELSQRQGSIDSDSDSVLPPVNLKPGKPRPVNDYVNNAGNGAAGAAGPADKPVNPRLLFVHDGCIYDHLIYEDFDFTKHTTQMYWFGYLVIPLSVSDDKDYQTAVRYMIEVSENFRNPSMSQALAQALIPLRNPDAWNASAEKYVRLLNTAASNLRDLLPN